MESSRNGWLHNTLWVVIVVQVVAIVFIWGGARGGGGEIGTATATTTTRLRMEVTALATLPAVTPPPSTASRPTVLVVLGNMPLNDVTPTIDTMTRVQTAVAYYRAHPSSSLLVFSGGPTAGRVSEAATMAAYAQSLGVRPEHVLLEEKARSTGENAMLSARLLLDRGIVPDKVFVVSKNDHLTWALPLFKRPAVPGHLFDAAEPLGCDVDVRDSIRQMETFLEEHPLNQMVRHRLTDLRNGVRGID